jgi:hypothetical protein
MKLTIQLERISFLIADVVDSNEANQAGAFVRLGLDSCSTLGIDQAYPVFMRLLVT